LHHGLLKSRHRIKHGFELGVRDGIDLIQVILVHLEHGELRIVKGDLYPQPSRQSAVGCTVVFMPGGNLPLRLHHFCRVALHRIDSTVKYLLAADSHDLPSSTFQLPANIASKVSNICRLVWISLLAALYNCWYFTRLAASSSKFTPEIAFF